uniref:Vasorin n=1 Tax=Sphenodon punctatus TaxID=8508 RepID=A0A8D0LBN6_SPHPU
MTPLMLWVLLLVPAGVFAQGCPTDCLCNQPQTVFCISRKSHTIPTGLPPNTATLYMFENGISHLSDDSFWGLPALQLLDLSQNKIASLPHNIFQPLGNLSNLDLSSNQLQEVTNETFHGLRQLERLYLDRNQIQNIHPAAFDTLESLLELKLQDNQLRAVPPLNLHRLLLLDLSHNRIAMLEASTFHAINLESLKIAGLGLSRLDEEIFQHLHNLHELDISDNQLSWVPKVLQRLHSLTKLNLAGNAQISQLRDEDFQELYNLQELDISNLNLNTIPRDFFSTFPRLRAITAAENPFNCICQLSWLVQWLQARKAVLRRSEETRCHFPPKNAGKLLQHLVYTDFGCPTTTTPSTTLKTTMPRSAVPLTTSRHPLLEPSTVSPMPNSVPRQDISTLTPLTSVLSLTSPKMHICPPRTCLNGGTCQLDAYNHLECVCPQGFSGLYCESQVRITTFPIATQASARTRQISIKQVGSTSLKVDLQNYVQSKVLLKGIRLTYWNLSGPDKRPVVLSLPASLSEYTVRALKPNSSYHICIRPLGEKTHEELCVEAQTLYISYQQHAPVTQTKDSNLTLMVVPAVAAVLLVVVAITALTYYICHQRAKAHTGPSVDSSPLELEGVKACLENGDLLSHSQKTPETMLLPNGLECEVPLMQQRYPSNNNTPGLKPSYF